MGFAETVAPVVALNPVEGDQAYVLAPTPIIVNVVELPVQIVAGGIFSVGNGLTVTITASLAAQPKLFVTVTVYVVVVTGETVITAVVAPLLQR